MSNDDLRTCLTWTSWPTAGVGSQSAWVARLACTAHEVPRFLSKTLDKGSPEGSFRSVSLTIGTTPWVLGIHTRMRKHLRHCWSARAVVTHMSHRSWARGDLCSLQHARAARCVHPPSPRRVYAMVRSHMSARGMCGARGTGERLRGACPYGCLPSESLSVHLAVLLAWPTFGRRPWLQAHAVGGRA